MYKNKPEPKNRAAKASALMTLIGGMLLFVLSNSGAIPLPWLAQTVAVIFLTFSIYVAAAYLLKRYTFIVDRKPQIDGDGGDCDFIITEQKGNRDIKVCHVSVNDIVFIREVNSTNKKEVNQDRKKKKRYTYDTQFWASRRLEIAINYTDSEPEEHISLLVTFDEKLINVLLAAGVKKI